jgi:DNA-binding response OmpR family regulator
LSGLTDEVLIRAGKELRVDDYLAKPFEEHALIATVIKLSPFSLRRPRQKA